MAALRAAMAARRSEEMVALAALAALAAPAATWAASSWDQWRLVAPAAMPVLSERAAMAATEPEEIGRAAGREGTEGAVVAGGGVVERGGEELCWVRLMR